MALTGDPPVVLAYRALGLGDLLTAVPSLRALDDGFPGRRLVLACPAWLHPLLPFVGDVAGLDTTPFEPLPPELGRPDVAVNLHGQGPESHRVLQATRPRRLVAYPNAAAGCPDGPAWSDTEHEVDRWARLVTHELGLVVDRTDLRLRLPFTPRRVLAVVHPGTKDPARRWPAARFGAVARLLSAAGLQVVVTGSAAEAGLVGQVCTGAGLGPDAACAGAHDLPALAGLVASASVTVSADTGIAHLATSVGTPSVVLFGPESPERWGPPAGHPHHLVHEPGVPARDLTTDPAEVAALALDLIAGADSRATPAQPARSGCPAR